MTLLSCAIAWLLAAAAFNLGWSPWSALALAPVATLWLPARNRWLRLVHVVAGIAAAALAVAVLIGPPPPLPADSIAQQIGEPTTLLVRARGDGDRHPSYVALTATVLARDVNGEWQRASGRLTTFLPAATEVRDGDELQLSGVLSPPGGSGAPAGYRDWLTRRGVVASLRDARMRLVAAAGPGGPLARLRERIQSELAAVLPSRDASFAFAVLFGGRHALPLDLNDDLVRSGTAHLAVVSAFNVALLFGAVLALGTPLVGRRRVAPLALLAALAYGALVGATPSVVRGEILVALLTLSLISGRPHSRAALLLLAAAAMTVPDARLLTDVAFQLTFAAAFGVALLTAPLQAATLRLLRMDEEQAQEAPAAVRVGLSAVALSVAVALACLPVLAGAFSALPTYGVLANAAVSPLVPATMALALATGVAGSLVQPLGHLLAAPLGLVLQAIEWTIHVGARLPGASVATPAAGIAFASAWYALLITIVLLQTQRRGAATRLLRGRVHPRAVHPQVLLRHRSAPAAAALALALGVAPASVVAARRLASGSEPSHAVVRWRETSLGTVAEVDGANGSRVLLVDGAAPSILAAVRASGGLGDRPVDAVVVARSDPRYADADPWRTAARATHAGTVLIALAPSPSGAGNAPGLQPEPGVLQVTGETFIELGAGDRVEILTDGRGAVVARVHIDGRSAVLAGTEDAGRVLDLYREEGAADIVVLPGTSSDRERQALADLKPSLVVVTGRSAPAPGSVRTIRLAETHDLALSADGGRLTFSYRDR